MNLYDDLVHIYPNIPGRLTTERDKKMHLEKLDYLSTYDSIIVLFSGGKDSVACVLHLLEIGVPKSKIELWHHDIDGGSDIKMDWDVTSGYVKSFAKAMNLPIRFSWRREGFFGELFREGPSHPVEFEVASGEIKTVYPMKWDEAKVLRQDIEEAELNDDMSGLEEARNKLHSMGYRYKFPAKSADLNSRWCSAYLKIMVGDTVLGHLERTHSDQKILLISGERREESASRAKYNEMEIHKKNAKRKNRIVHHWRPVIDYLEEDVWSLIKRHGVVPHPVYFAGWNRCSCAMCIFGLPKHWAGIKQVYPDRYKQLVELEKTLDFTIDNKKDLVTYVGSAESCSKDANLEKLKELKSEEYDPEAILIEPSLWALPLGAYQGAAGGPC